MQIDIEITKKTEAELQALDVSNWPIWTSGVSEFPWRYDLQESCYILEGEVEVSTAKGKVRFGSGDFVVFPEGLQCTWKIIMPVKKHYKLGKF